MGPFVFDRSRNILPETNPISVVGYRLLERAIRLPDRSFLQEQDWRPSPYSCHDVRPFLGDCDLGRHSGNPLHLLQFADVYCRRGPCEISRISKPIHLTRTTHDPAQTTSPCPWRVSTKSETRGRFPAEHFRCKIGADGKPGRVAGIGKKALSDMQGQPKRRRPKKTKTSN